MDSRYSYPANHPFPTEYSNVYIGNGMQQEREPCQLPSKRRKNNILTIKDKRIKRVVKIMLTGVWFVFITILETLNLYIKYRVMHYVSLTQYTWVNYLLFVDILRKFAIACLKIQEYYREFRLNRKKRL